MGRTRGQVPGLRCDGVARRADRGSHAACRAPGRTTDPEAAHGERHFATRGRSFRMKASETPVLIVGGGPVGLALAAELGWRGVPCTLIEQSDGRITTPKMNEVNTRTMEFCRRWGIADRVMRCPFPDDYPLDVVFVTTAATRSPVWNDLHARISGPDRSVR